MVGRAPADDEASETSLFAIEQLGDPLRLAALSGQGEWRGYVEC